MATVLIAGCEKSFVGDSVQNDLALKGAKVECTTIQSGTLLGSDGEVIETGYDQWGYNYQSHLFNGLYCDSYRDAAWCQEWKDVKLSMKWNDAWLSNTDCDGDGKLDRHLGFDSFIGSGAWLTNHQSGEYVGVNEETCKWNYFVKIVAAPTDAVLTDGIWYADGVEIGPVIWGEFAIIQQVENDACAGLHGLQYVSPTSAGLGQFTNKQIDEMTLNGWIKNPANKHYYLLLEETDWADAEAQAVELGGHLVTINDEAEDLWLENHFGTYRFWIGLNDRELDGTWVWVSGEDVTYTHWGNGEPTYGGDEEENAVVVEWSIWNNLPDWHFHHAIVEIEKL